MKATGLRATGLCTICGVPVRDLKRHRMRKHGIPPPPSEQPTPAVQVAPPRANVSPLLKTPPPAPVLPPPAAAALSTSGAPATPPPQSEQPTPEVQAAPPRAPVTPLIEIYHRCMLDSRPRTRPGRPLQPGARGQPLQSTAGWTRNSARSNRHPRLLRPVQTPLLQWRRVPANRVTPCCQSSRPRRRRHRQQTNATPTS